MTEAELWDLLFQAFSLVGMGMTVFMTIVSAYLAAAYFTGSRLGRYQIALVSVLFVFFAAFAAFMTFIAFERAFHFARLLEGRHDFVRYLPDWAPMAQLLLNALLIGAALFFMHQIRSRPGVGAHGD